MATATMVDRVKSDLEDKLEQAEAILAYKGKSIRRMMAVRSLLSDFSSASVPVRNRRPTWDKIAQALLLEDDTATPRQIQDLRRSVGELRKAVRDHRDRADG